MQRYYSTDQSTLHRLQPLDVTFYAALKTAYNGECTKYMQQHPFDKITPFEIAQLVNNVLLGFLLWRKPLRASRVLIFIHLIQIFLLQRILQLHIYKITNNTQHSDVRLHENKTHEPTEIETSLFEHMLSGPSSSERNPNKKNQEIKNSIPR